MTEFFELGRISKPQGIKGEIKFDAYTDDLSRFSYLEQVYFLREDGSYEAVQVLSARVDARYAYLKLAGYDDRNAAEALRGVMVYIDREHAAQLPQGAHYVRDLIGLDVVTQTGDVVGKLSDIMQNGAADVYVVKTQTQGNCMFPSIPGVVLEKDIPGGKIIVDEERLREVSIYDDI
ncbi:MAG: ribosome maturation factor RimM [Christensenella sp.]|uniref:ribosome maturation factor RimM n=1 Tax=Christensenella sp. TaxID=1935934 RepID=UPI002B1E94D7|nr:ribosome maturation factor RimM [Christensenella sp.]MEA5003080.1 ribosome maturation factor RimM [Christensenella sp.]